MMIRNIRLKFFFCLSTLIWMPIGNMAQTKIDSVPCGADGLLVDSHDAVRGLIFYAHFVEDEE